MVAESGADTAGDELETFETHVGMVEPVDEDDAEVSPTLSLGAIVVQCFCRLQI